MTATSLLYHCDIDGSHSCPLLIIYPHPEVSNVDSFQMQLPPDSVDIEILHDATRREARGA